ncbi:protein heat intolerant 4 [Tanacetum coccineum]
MDINNFATSLVFSSVLQPNTIMETHAHQTSCSQPPPNPTQDGSSLLHTTTSVHKSKTNKLVECHPICTKAQRFAKNIQEKKSSLKCKERDKTKVLVSNSGKWKEKSKKRICKETNEDFIVSPHAHEKLTEFEDGEDDYFYNPFAEDGTEESTIVGLLYPAETPVYCGFDGDVDKVEEYTNNLIAEEELSEDQKDAFKEFLKESVQERKRANREARQKRKQALEELSQEKLDAINEVVEATRLIVIEKGMLHLALDEFFFELAIYGLQICGHHGSGFLLRRLAMRVAFNPGKELPGKLTDTAETT